MKLGVRTFDHGSPQSSRSVEFFEGNESENV